MTRYFVYQNPKIGSIEETKKNYEYIMRQCLKQKFEKESKTEDDKFATTYHDTFYDNDGNLVCCLSRFEHKKGE